MKLRLPASVASCINADDRDWMRDEGWGVIGVIPRRYKDDSIVFDGVSDEQAKIVLTMAYEFAERYVGPGVKRQSSIEGNAALRWLLKHYPKERII